MPRSRPPSRQSANSFDSARPRVALLCAALMFAVPLVVVFGPGAYDSFRLPKEILFRAGAIITTAAILTGAVFRKFRLQLSERRNTAIVIATGALVWTVVTALTATNRWLALEALVTVVCSIFFFIAASSSAPDSLTVPAVALLAPAVMNSVVYLAQKYGNRALFPVDIDAIGGRDMANVGLLGNANDLGSFLVVATVAATGFALAERGLPRITFFATAALLVITLLATQRQTAVLSCACGIVSFIPLLRRGRAAIGAGTLLLVCGLLLIPNFNQRFRNTLSLVRSGDYDQALTGRLLPFASALQMIHDHPVTGVGPGCFKYNYFDYRLRAEQKYPRLLLPSQGRGLNYAETHNDHLQILSETGFPGYILFLAALVIAASWSFRRVPEPRTTRAFARFSATPLAVSLFVLAVAQFPLQIAPPRVAYLYLFALCERWGREE